MATTRKNALKPDEPEEVTNSNWAILRFDYGADFALPIKEATQVIACFDKASQLKEEYQKAGEIIPLESKRVSLTLIPLIESFTCLFFNPIFSSNSLPLSKSIW